MAAQVAIHADVGCLFLFNSLGSMSVNDPPVLGELFQLAGHAIVEADAEGKQQSASLIA